MTASAMEMWGRSSDVTFSLRDDVIAVEVVVVVVEEGRRSEVEFKVAREVVLTSGGRDIGSKVMVASVIEVKVTSRELFCGEEEIGH